LFKKNDWELIPSVSPVHVYNEKLDLLGGSLFNATSYALTINSFSIDPKTICIEAHETTACEQLDKLGFEVIPIPYDKVVAFGGILHCTTLDIYREGTLEDYFPKQIPGY